MSGPARPPPQAVPARRVLLGAGARALLVAVTALAMRGDEARARAAGFDSYLTKPVDRSALEETVGRLLKAGTGTA